MPLVHGYSRQAIGENIRRETGRPLGRTGKKKSPRQAVAIALSEARRAYRERHPTGPWPAHLAPRRRRNPSSGPDLGTLLVVGLGAWLLLSRRGAAAASPVAVMPQPEAPDPGACAGRPLIPYSLWWQRYQNNNQPPPPGRVFPDALVPDCPAGPTYASALAAREGIPARRGLFG